VEGLAANHMPQELDVDPAAPIAFSGLAEFSPMINVAFVFAGRRFLSQEPAPRLSGA
jgi:hypothetical protein